MGNDGKYGFINTAGQLMVPLEYDNTSNFSEGLAWVQKSGKCGFVNAKGKMVIPLEYDYADDFVAISPY